MGVRSTFAKRLKETRERAGLSQDDFGKRCGVSRGAVSYYEKEARAADIEFVEAVAREFGVPTDWLLGLTDAQDLANAGTVHALGIVEQAVDVLKQWTAESKPIADEKSMAMSSLCLRAQDRLTFIGALICSTEIDRLSEMAFTFSCEIKRAIEEVQFFVDLAEHVLHDIAAGKEPEIKLIERDFAKAISSSEAVYGAALLNEYQSKELYNEFLESIAGHSKQELRALQKRVRELQRLVLEGGDPNA